MPQGKLLGGSSGLNGQTLVAPSKVGIDAWAALGNSSNGVSPWDWKSLSPYYRKFFTLNLPEAEIKKHLGLDWINEDVVGESGPIQASFTGTLDNPMPKAWNDAFRKLGLETTADPFTGNSTGAYANVSTVDPVTKTRSYAASAYAAPVFDRPNLEFVFGANVQKILFEKPDSGDVKATGSTLR